jgi:hypothetical protein
MKLDSLHNRDMQTNLFTRFKLWYYNLLKLLISIYDPVFQLLLLLLSTSILTYLISGDANNVQIGSGTNIQDNSLVHVAKSNLSGKVFPTIIGDNVTVGKYDPWFLPYTCASYDLFIQYSRNI